MKKRNKHIQSNGDNDDKRDSDDNTDLFQDFTTFPPAVLKWIESNSINPIVIWDTSGHILYVPQQITDLLGYFPDELIGNKWEEHVPEKDAIFLKEHANWYATSHQTRTLPIKNRQGTPIWCECTMKRVEENNGNTYFIVFLRDISDKKEAEEMLVRSEKMTIAGQIASGIAHEIRNPLTSIKGFLQLLEAGVNYKDDYYRIMIDEIKKVEAITSELLFISKPMTDNKEMADVENMMDDVIVLLRPQASLNGSQIIWNRHGDHTVYCNRSQIKQVFINLVKNAYEAMEKGGNVEISVSQTNTEIHVYVIDEGPGVSDELINKLYEPFFTTKQNGTGLGLMIVNQILERHNGGLYIYQNEEIGSTFQMTLPSI